MALELAVNARLGSDHTVSVHHFTALIEDYSPGDLIDKWQSIVRPYYVGCMSDTMALTLLRCVDLATGDVVEVPDTTPGTVGGDPLPLQNAAVITWRTGIAGRSYRGRTYMPGLTEGHQSMGILDSTIMTALGNYGGIYLSSNVFTNDYVLGVYSRKLSHIQNVVSFTVQPYVKTQRRREIGVGS